MEELACSYIECIHLMHDRALFGALDPAVLSHMLSASKILATLPTSS